ncbi:hypothetical protein L7F22_029021 [Adiantum nelumboides]|nr:hypothetical protein [Adiantum nelumboides]
MKETGVDTKFVEVFGFRQSHDATFRKSNLFLLCKLLPLSSEIVLRGSRQMERRAQASWCGVGQGDEASEVFCMQRAGEDKGRRGCGVGRPRGLGHGRASEGGGVRSREHVGGTGDKRGREFKPSFSFHHSLVSGSMDSHSVDPSDQNSTSAKLLWSYSALIITVLVGTAYLVLHAWQASFRKKPPGPKSLPIIGHLHLLGAKPHSALFNLSKLHGPLMWLRFGSIPVIVASSPQTARLILQTHDQIFAGRPRLIAAVATLYNCTNISFCAPNSYWRMMRQICVTDLVSPKRVDAFGHVREAEVHMLVRAVEKEIIEGGSGAQPDRDEVSANASNPGYAPSKTIDASAQGRVMVAMRTHLLQASNNMISSMVFGKTLHEMVASGSDAVDCSLNLLHLLDELIQCLGIFNLSDLFPSLAWMDIQGVRHRSICVARKLNIVLQGILDSRRQSRSLGSNSEDSTCQDLLDVLLALPSKEHEITDDNIKAFIIDMFVGGTDTSAYTIEWALAELLANPSELKLVQEEIDKVVGRERMVRESDIAGLPYLRAIVNETMRLHPVVPFLIPHVATQPCKLMDFDVPKHTQVYVNVWAIGRDADTWSEPLIFKPSRFLDSPLSVGTKTYELLAFGAGRRGCPGSLLGLLNVQIQLASLLQSFHWWAPPNFDIEDKFGIMTVKAKPLVAMAASRLALHLYLSNCNIK